MGQQVGRAMAGAVLASIAASPRVREPSETPEMTKAKAMIIAGKGAFSLDTSRSKYRVFMFAPEHAEVVKVEAHASSRVALGHTVVGKVAFDEGIGFSDELLVLTPVSRRHLLTTGTIRVISDFTED